MINGTPHHARVLRVATFQGLTEVADADIRLSPP